MPDQSNCKLLIHFDGADEAQAYTAETGQTVTFVGTAQLDTAQKEFGTASLLLDGDSDYVTVPDSDDWDFGTGNFTIDFRVRFNGWSTGSDWNFFMNQYVDGTHTWQLAVNDDNGLYIYFIDGGDQLCNYTQAGENRWSPSLDTWYHVAYVRNGTSIHVFVDGIEQVMQENVAVGNKDLGNIAAPLNIGRYNDANPFYLDGWIDEVHIEKGTARWTSNFTAPTSAYSVPTLLIHFNGADEAQAYTTEDAAARTVTFINTAQLDTAQKKFGTASLLLDGTDDVVTIPDSDNWSFDSGDFTVDFWVRFNAFDNEASDGFYTLLFGGSGGGYFQLDYKGSANELRFIPYQSGVAQIKAETWNPSVDIWYHIAFVRGGDNLYTFVDGVQLGTPTSISGAIDEPDDVLCWGARPAGGGYDRELNGWIDEVHIEKGTARWTSNFTPPSGEYFASYGLRIKDANGNVLLDTSDLIVRIRYSNSVASGASSSTTLSDISGKTTYAFSIPLELAKVPHAVSISGTTFSWTAQSSAHTTSSASLVGVIIAS